MPKITTAILLSRALARSNPDSISQETQIKVIKILALYYKVPVRVIQKDEQEQRAGYYDSLKKRITVIMQENPAYDLLSVFFHEWGHAYCHKNGIWEAYHQPGVVKKGKLYLSTDLLKKVIKTAYKAECWIDKFAKKEMLRWFPNLPFNSGYLNDREAKRWLHENYLFLHKAILKKRAKIKKLG